MGRCGKFVCAFDRMRNLLPINYAALPEFYRQSLERHARKAVISAVPDTSLSTLDQYNHGLNFCHWMTDYIPRILGADELSIDFKTVIGPFALEHDFQKVSIQHASPNRNYVDVGPGKMIEFDAMIYTDDFGDRHPLSDCNPVLLGALRQRFAGTIQERRSPAKLYVPRKQARRVDNDMALWQLLSAHDFVRVDTDCMPFYEQIHMFSAATHIVAPHGAALTNLCFCAPGTFILELFPQFGGSAAFYCIAAAAELNYSCFIDAPQHGEIPTSGIGPVINTAPIRVDLEFVKRWLSLT
jgi:capsular polysaccharide biosynthesis protein